ncbi:hypothetical protein F66182_2280 [Fusarium sp. NRRL 66182]|nr:hypothetical protein F66182_2280 [Fusarium sp. NRRL 66182]
MFNLNIFIALLSLLTQTVHSRLYSPRFWHRYNISHFDHLHHHPLRPGALPSLDHLIDGPGSTHFDLDHPHPLGHLPRTRPEKCAACSDRLGAVASESNVCSTIGTETLRSGGNAADAMIAMVYCVGTVAMYHSGIGGGGFMIIKKAHSNRVLDPYEFIDFRETAPAAATKDMFEDDASAAVRGGKASGVPGELRGLEYLKRYSVLSRKKLIEPSIKLARDGFIVNHDMARFMTTTYTKSENESFLVNDPSWAIDFAPKGKLIKFGERMTRKRYAAVLEEISQNGEDAFYEGPIAEATIRALNQSGGIMTTEDLRNYSVVAREPTRINYRGRSITTGSAPSSGAVVAAALKILERYDFLGDPRRVNIGAHAIDEAVKFGFGMRSKLGDPDFVKGLKAYQKMMVSEDTAQHIREKITDGPLRTEAYNPEGLEILDTPGTAQLVATDQSGLSISFTTTVNLIFGSKLMVPETGVVMNNNMNDFSVPGKSKAFGLLPGEANYIKPGKRPLSSMSPIIVEEIHDASPLVTGASGGTRIITAILQVIVNVLDKKMTLSEALKAPGLHDQLSAQKITFEYSFDNSTVAYLAKMGHNITWVGPGQSAVQAVSMSPNRTFEAVAEPRQENSEGFAT